MNADSPAPAEVRRALRDVLERPDFATAEPFWLLRVLGEAFAAVRRRIAEWLTDLLALQDLHPVVFWLIVGWLVLSLVALAGHLVWMLASGSRRGGRGEERPGPDPVRLDERDAARWEAESRWLAGEGRFRDAVVALYRAVLLRMEERGQVRFHEARTPGEYLRELDDSGLRGAFEPLFRGFVVLAYGGRPVGEGDYRRFHRRAQEATGRG